MKKTSDFRTKLNNLIWWKTLLENLLRQVHQVAHSKYNPYHAEINEQNSGENWSEGAQGGGCSTISSISPKILVHPSACSGGEYGNLPVAHSSNTSPKLQISAVMS